MQTKISDCDDWLGLTINERADCQCHIFPLCLSDSDSHTTIYDILPDSHCHWYSGSTHNKIILSFPPLLSVTFSHSTFIQHTISILYIKNKKKKLRKFLIRILTQIVWRGRLTNLMLNEIYWICLAAEKTSPTLSIPHLIYSQQLQLCNEGGNENIIRSLNTIPNYRYEFRFRRQNYNFCWINLFLSFLTIFLMLSIWITWFHW